MTTVTALLNKELQNIKEQKEKRDQANKSVKDRMFGLNQNNADGDEIRELETKLDSMEIPPEAKQIYKREIKKKA